MNWEKPKIILQRNNKYDLLKNLKKSLNEMENKCILNVKKIWCFDFYNFEILFII